MLELLQFIFEDFWRFLMTCVLLVILVQWTPVEIVRIKEVKNNEDE